VLGSAVPPGARPRAAGKDGGRGCSEAPLTRPVSVPRRRGAAHGHPQPSAPSCSSRQREGCGDEAASGTSRGSSTRAPRLGAATAQPGSDGDGGDACTWQSRWPAPGRCGGRDKGSTQSKGRPSPTCEAPGYALEGWGAGKHLGKIRVMTQTAAFPFLSAPDQAEQTWAGPAPLSAASAVPEGCWNTAAPKACGPVPKAELGRGDSVSERGVALAPHPPDAAAGGMERAVGRPQDAASVFPGLPRRGLGQAQLAKPRSTPGPAAPPGRGAGTTAAPRRGKLGLLHPQDLSACGALPQGSLQGGKSAAAFCTTKPPAAPLSCSPSPIINSFSGPTGFPCCHIPSEGRRPLCSWGTQRASDKSPAQRFCANLGAGTSLRHAPTAPSQPQLPESDGPAPRWRPPLAAPRLSSLPGKKKKKRSDDLDDLDVPPLHETHMAAPSSAWLGSVLAASARRHPKPQDTVQTPSRPRSRAAGAGTRWGLHSCSPPRRIPAPQPSKSPSSSSCFSPSRGATCLWTCSRTRSVLL